MAIKLIRASSYSGPERSRAADRMLLEAKALAQLSHEHVVAVFDVGSYALRHGDRGVFVVMELLEGPSLSQWLRTSPSVAEILRVFRLAGEGLAAAHRRGLVHRDFKPANVVLDARGLPKVVDFGLALTAQRGWETIGGSDDSDSSSSGMMLGARVTQTGIVLGTPRYMAPEQHAGEAIGPAADQYAFCVSLWGSRPRDSNTAKLHAFSRKRLGSRGFLGVCDASGVPWGLGSSAVLVETAWRRTRCAPTWSRPVTSEVTTSGSKAAANQRTRAATSAGIVPTAIPAARPSIPPTPIAMHPIAPVSAASRAAGKSSATYPEGWARTARRPTSRPPSNAAAPTMGMHHAVHAGPPQACGMWQALSPTTMGSEPATSPGTMARLHARPW